MTGLLQDVRFALRQLRKNPAFAAVAILSLALGIGANTAIFSLINSLMLKSLPVANPQQLVTFGKGAGGGVIDGIGPGPLDLFPYDFYKQIEAQHDPFVDVCATSSFPSMISMRRSSQGAAQQASAELVSGTFFRTLGVEPILGRTISPEDTDASGRNPVVVLSYRYWNEKLGADRSVIGAPIVINGTAFTVIGVTPPRFFGVELNAESPDLWAPVTMQEQVMLQPSLLKPHDLFWLHVIGRRKPVVTVAQAQAWTTKQIQTFMVEREGAQISEQRRAEIRQIYVELISGGHGISVLREQFLGPLFVLMAVVVLVLAIACMNLANFLLAKAAAREREFATRLAIGASRGAIVRSVLTEALLLSFLGGAAGLVVALLGTRFLVQYVVGGSTSSGLSPAPDVRVLMFTVGISLFTGILFGIAPAWRTSRSQVATTFNSGMRTASGTGSSSGKFLPRALVAGQVALSLTLLVGAGLFVHTLQNLRRQDLGFNQRNLLLVELNAKLAGYKADQVPSLQHRMLERVDALPGVRSAALSGGMPLSHGSWMAGVQVDGYKAAPDEDLSTRIEKVSPRYFETTQMAMVEGRAIAAQDTPTSVKAVVVNQAFAKHFFPNASSVGHRFTLMNPGAEGPWQIVGVVRDAKYTELREDPRRMIYLTLAQLKNDDAFAGALQVRAEGDPAKITNEVRRAIAEIDPALPILSVTTIADTVAEFMENERLISELAGFFSILALFLACIGLYGVMTHNVTRRTNEIGVRIAMGAQPRGILWMILRESALLLSLGLLVGLPATIAMNRVLQSQLFGLQAFDALTIFSAVFAVALVVLGAGYLPALRASKVDPMVALRYE